MVAHTRFVKDFRDAIYTKTRKYIGLVANDLHCNTTTTFTSALSHPVNDTNEKLVEIGVGVYILGRKLVSISRPMDLTKNVDIEKMLAN